MRKTYQSIGSFAVLMLCAGSGPAFAQTGADASASSSGDIIVTARRREETLQDVPATIQVISTKELARRNVQGEWDLPAAVPGLFIRTNNSQNQLNYVIRGESMEPYSGSVPGVQPYINEVALSGSIPISFFDLESVQVLKGPQGTLFGRNSTGGAVLYQTAKPTSEAGGKLSIQYGNLDIFIGEAALNVPIMEDTVLLRVAGKMSSGGAFIKNIYNDTRQGDSDLNSARGTLIIKPSNAITNETMVQYDDYEGTNYGRYVFYVEPCGGVGRNFTCWANGQNAFFQDFVSSAPGTYFPGWPSGFVYPGGLPGLPEFLKSQGRYVVDQNGPQEYNGDATVVINTTTLELSSSLTIKNIFGYARAQRSFAYDNDATPYPFLQGGGTAPGGAPLEHQYTRTYSDELQLQGTALDDRLNYILGVFYSDHRVVNNSALHGFGYNPAANFPFNFNIRYKARSKDKSTAVFAQGTYALTDQLNVTAGFRQTWDKLAIDQLEGSLFFGRPGNHTKVNDQSWTFSLDYKVTPELMLYATTRGSWRVGGYNPFVGNPVSGENRLTAENGGNYFQPERVRDVEVGAKFAGRIGGMPAHFNIDAYNVWVENSQKTAYTVLNGNITSATVTIPKAKVTGVEADGDISPADWLQLGGTVSYQDARFTDNVAGLYGQTTEFGPYADAPKWSGSIFANVTVPMAGDAGTLRYHADLYLQSSFHVSNLGNTFNPGDKLPGYHLLNMRLDWEDPMNIEGLTLSAFAKNLTNELYFSGGSGSVALYSTNSGLWGQPRTYGFALSGEF